MQPDKNECVKNRPPPLRNETMSPYRNFNIAGVHCVSMINYSILQSCTTLITYSLPSVPSHLVRENYLQLDNEPKLVLYIHAVLKPIYCQ